MASPEEEPVEEEEVEKVEKKAVKKKRVRISTEEDAEARALRLLEQEF